ncbi:hypothetical protein S40288_11448 [Stachybotrys chartarum IBT 40288]|nr:hypothetical protein S40288_11448 [Stachybotrys chartarum IBT 40288]
MDSTSCTHATVSAIPLIDWAPGRSRAVVPSARSTGNVFQIAEPKPLPSRNLILSVIQEYQGIRRLRFPATDSSRGEPPCCVVVALAPRAGQPSGQHHKQGARSGGRFGREGTYLTAVLGKPLSSSVQPGWGARGVGAPDLLELGGLPPQRAHLAPLDCAIPSTLVAGLSNLLLRLEVAACSCGKFKPSGRRLRARKGHPLLGPWGGCGPHDRCASAWRPRNWHSRDDLVQRLMT